MSKKPDETKLVAPTTRPSTPSIAAPRRLGMVSKLIADKANALDYGTSQNTQALIVPIDRLTPNPNQPRKVIDEERDLELADNIRENGILEPLIVRETAEGQYEIVAGERRYRAARLAGKTTVPVIVKNYDDEQAQLVSVIENLQRVDLDALDEAHYFKFLSDNYNYSYRKIAAMIHRSYSYVSDRMRLLELDEDNLNNPTDNSEKDNNRQKNNQKLQNSQSKTRLPKREVRYSPKSLFSFGDWLSKTRNNLPSLRQEEKAELRDKLSELRAKIEELERELPEE